MSRGRPRTNGVQAGWMLGRAILVLEAYDRSRQAGAKHVTAVAEAAASVGGRRPGMPISQTEVRRILAKWRRRELRGNPVVQTMLPGPERTLDGIAAGEGHDEIMRYLAELNGTQPGPAASVKKVHVVSVRFGRDPNYPRINSKRPKQ